MVKASEKREKLYTQRKKMTDHNNYNNNFSISLQALVGLTS
jgi:hypothetical protein